MIELKIENLLWILLSNLEFQFLLIYNWFVSLKFLWLVQKQDIVTTKFNKLNYVT
jgi:hypothetical protein